MGLGATIGASALSAGVGAVGSALQSSAISKGQSQALAAQEAMYNTTRNDLLPYNTAGQAATTQEQSLLGLNGQDAANAAMSTYQTSPGYQWSLSQGLRAVDAGAAASGLARSGANEKAELTFGQGLANNDFSQYYSRLAGLSTTGENAAAQTGQAGTAAANAESNIDTGAAGAQSSIYGNAASGLSSTINKLFSNTAFQNQTSNY